LPSPVFAHGQLYVACSRATLASNIRVLVEDCEDQQRKLPGDQAGSAVVYTLNLVDRTLLCDSEAVVAPDMQCECAAHSASQAALHADNSFQMEATAADADVDERRRLATIPPVADAIVMRPPLMWGEAARNPLSADEWAYIEPGIAKFSVKSSNEVLLEHSSFDSLEYVSDDEAGQADVTSSEPVAS